MFEQQFVGVQCDGGFAERCVVPARALVRLPAAVDFKTSAALTLAGSTAMHMLTDRVKTAAGDWVLVVGGASGVGSAAVQIARGLGAKVVTTASTRRSAHFASRSERTPSLMHKIPNGRRRFVESRRSAAST